MRRISLLIVYFILSIQLVAHGMPQAYINDYANVLGHDTVQRLNNRAQSLEYACKAQLVVVIVETLDGVPIDDYAYKNFNDWGLGDSELDNGVLIVIAPNERESRIEVGKGLEGRLTDGKTGRIQDEYLIPYVKENNYDAAVENTFNALYVEICEEYDIRPEENISLPQGSQDTESGNGFGKLIIAIMVIVLLIVDWTLLGGAITRFIILVLFMNGGRGGRGGGGTGGFGGGGFSGGGGRSGGGGSSRGW